MGGSPSRPASFARGGDVNVAPGQYNSDKEFGVETKSFRIGEKRIERTVEGLGPGAYSPERADAMTKSKIVNFNMGSSPSRPMSFARGGDVDVAPGQYDDGQRFNSNAKSFKIGEKREERITKTLGPGEYDHEKADAMTKTKLVNVNMGSSPSRPVSFARGGDVNVAPGQYDDGQRWNSNSKSFRIGEKRETRVVDGVGPG